jgi:serine/threonine protein phosphatase PrpC
MMGVADGHGLQGHHVSNYVKVNLPKILAKMINSRPTDKPENSMNPNKNNGLPNIQKDKRKNSPFEIDGPMDTNPEEKKE